MSSNALAIRDAAPVVTPDQHVLIMRTIAAGATADELKLYLYDCARQGVHPLDGLIHFVKRSGKYKPVTSIDFLRIRAAETGEYAGNDDPRFTYGGHGPDTPDAATVTVYRLVDGEARPFSATARWREYFPGDPGGHMWRKMPHTMLGKCAEALALRKGFPRQLAGLVTAEEMDQAGGAELAPDAPPPTPAPEPDPEPDPIPRVVGAITEPQRKRLFAIARESGLSHDQVKAWLEKQGYTSSKDIAIADYDRLCALLGGAKGGAIDSPFSS